MKEIIDGIITTAKVIVSLAIIVCTLIALSYVPLHRIPSIGEWWQDRKATANFDAIMERQNKAVKNR